MIIRIAILAACTSTLVLALTATTGTAVQAEKTFLDGDASFGIAKAGKKTTALPKNPTKSGTNGSVQRNAVGNGSSGKK